MKKNYFWIFIFFISITFSFSQSNDDAKSRWSDYETRAARDSLGIRKVLKMPNLQFRNAAIQTAKLPYPILFIHGLNSDSNTWNTLTNYMDSQYQLQYGGRFDFCLNYDSNNALANKNSYPTPNADIARFTTTLVSGDYYYLNFDLGNNGVFNPTSTAVLSNQSAIQKQAVALKRAVTLIMQITGSDKVVVVGHSMGGLCGREYLQNASYYQADGFHHIAKLGTLGTPNTGSNASLSILNGIIAIDNQSEAMRDLKTSYFYNGQPGAFLFGGIESNSYMDDMLFSNFYNIDVNCNGIVGETIAGINSKVLPNNLDFACLYGTGNFLTGGDGVVSNSSANINSVYPNTTNNIFSSGAIHTSLTSQIAEVMQTFDEPNSSNLGYKINLDQLYLGFVSQQAAGQPVTDVDYYRLEIPAAGNYTFNETSTATQNISVKFSNPDGSFVGNTISNTSPSMSIVQSLPAGTINLAITNINPSSTSYQVPYRFEIKSAVLVNENFNSSNFNIFPNPTANILHFDNSNAEFQTITISNVLGMVIETKTISNADTQIDISSYQNGLYFLKFAKDGSSKTIKIMKN